MLKLISRWKDQYMVKQKGMLHCFDISALHCLPFICLPDFNVFQSYERNVKLKMSNFSAVCIIYNLSYGLFTTKL